MKVSETKVESGRCDFCGVGKPVTTINGGLWWVCAPCMAQLYQDRDDLVGGEEE